MDRVPLSAHFAIEEFTRSDVAERHGLKIEVTAGSPVAHALGLLCGSILETVRLALGPVQILSGYRPDEVNKLVGGASSSQHTKGEAADIVIAGKTPLEICRWLEASDLPFDQCIHEFGRWCHVSVNAHGGAPRRQCLTAYFDKHDGVTAYAAGLHELAELEG